MSREIKFRVWDKKSGKFICAYQNGLRFTLDTGQIYLNGTNFTDDYVLCQYTGIKDKNGVEIYEGDIISCEDYPFIDDEKQNYIGVVEYIYCQWQYVLHCVNRKRKGVSNGINGGINDNGVDHGELSDWIVLGNIHENPELMQHW